MESASQILLVATLTLVGVVAAVPMALVGALTGLMCSLNCVIPGVFPATYTLLKSTLAATRIGPVTKTLVLAATPLLVPLWIVGNVLAATLGAAGYVGGCTVFGIIGQKYSHIPQAVADSAQETVEWNLTGARKRIQDVMAEPPANGVAFDIDIGRLPLGLLLVPISFIVTAVTGALMLVVHTPYYLFVLLEWTLSLTIKAFFSQYIALSVLILPFALIGMAGALVLGLIVLAGNSIILALRVTATESNLLDMPGVALQLSLASVAHVMEHIDWFAHIGCSGDDSKKSPMVTSQMLLASVGFPNNAVTKMQARYPVQGIFWW